MRTSAAEWAGHASAKVRITAAMAAIRDRLLIRGPPLASRATDAQALSRAFYISKRNRLNRRYTTERRRRAD
jgi:hypothetical protein